MPGLSQMMRMHSITTTGMTTASTHPDSVQLTHSDHLKCKEKQQMVKINYRMSRTKTINYKVDLHKTKNRNKVFTLTNNKRRRQLSEPIRIWSNYMHRTPSAGKCTYATRKYWFSFCFSLAEKEARLLANHRAKKDKTKANANRSSQRTETITEYCFHCSA